MWQQGWSSIIIPQWIKMSISAHPRHPQSWPVATERQAWCTFNLPVHHPLCSFGLKDTRQSPRRGSGTCLETTSATPWWPAELSQLQNQGHARRGPDFIITKTLLATACLELAWGDSTVYFPAKHFEPLLLKLSFFHSLAFLAKMNTKGIHPKRPNLCLQRHHTLQKYI